MDGNDRKTIEETLHRTLGSGRVIKDDPLLITDESGVIHCVDARNGMAHWTHDMQASSWSTPLIAGDKVYVTNLSSGAVIVFKLSREKEIISEMNVNVPIYNTPVVANGVLFIAAFNRLYAIAAKDNPQDAAN